MLTLARSLLVATLLAGAGVALSGCSQTFATAYPASPQAARDWHVADVRIVVPETLTTSDVDTLVPPYDIVWHGEPKGDRRAQVGALLDEAARRAVADLKGPRLVVFTLQLEHFHSLTPRAYRSAPAGTGVHSASFALTVSDARTGEVLAGPHRFEASMPAQTAAELGQLPVAGIGAQWRRQISAHLTATLRGWLGTGPDNRTNFTRLGA